MAMHTWFECKIRYDTQTFNKGIKGVEENETPIQRKLREEREKRNNK